MKQTILSLLVGMALYSGSAVAQDTPGPKQTTIYTSEKPLLLLQDGDKTYKLESAAIHQINPEWIDEVRVIKQTSATEKYVSEGENGVVILAFKKDVKEAKKYLRQVRKNNEKVTNPIPKGVFRN